MLHMNSTYLLVILSTSLLPAHVVHAQSGYNEGKFNQVVAKMESDVLELAQKVEDLFLERCSLATFESCDSSNFDDCLSFYPAPTCPGGDSFVTPHCGDGIMCSGLFDVTVSSVSLPSPVVSSVDGNPTDPEVIETVCFTKQLDDWFQSKRNADFEYWRSISEAQPQGMYFGSYTGAFRIYPARQSEHCGEFDPRVRPWYVAASSGPKNVVMVLDVSRSMADDGKLDLLKEAAQRVVSTLAVGDRVALVTFNDDASAVTDEGGVMFQATEANKAMLISAISGLQADDNTNFYAGFQKAFEILNQSIDGEYYVNCNTAVLFLTDGVMTKPDDLTPEQVMDFIVEGIRDVQGQLDHPVLLFTYSIASDSKVELFPKQLACATERGVWSSIKESNDIVDSLSSYYQLLSLGIGSQTNFTAWVEPYPYKDGGVLGTTVSAPVYDRTKTPPLPIGVVGIDFSIAALNAALGTDSSEEIVKRIAVQSSASCPSLNLSLCDLESYRKQGSDDAICTSNCTNFVDTAPQKCVNVSNEWYPSNLWINTENEGKSYPARTCCEVGTNTTSDQCKADDKKIGVIVGATVGGVFALYLAVMGVHWYIYRRVPAKKTKTVEYTSQ